MSDQRPTAVQKLIDSGHGHITERTEDGITTSFYVLSLREMEAMGPEERERLGLEAMYQFALDHQNKV